MATFYRYHTIAPVIVLAVFLSVCLLCGDTAFSAIPDEADLFEQAYGHYQARQFEKAAELFALHVKEYQNSSVGDSALYWQAKSLIRLQRPDDALRSLNTLLEKYPESTFNSFARQELDVLKPTASEIRAADKRPDTLQSEVQLKRLQEPDACSDYLNKAEDRLRSFKDKLADASARNLSLQNELNTAASDKKYLSAMVDELRHGQDGATKNVAEIVQLKEENESLHREINKLSASRKSAVAVDSSKKEVVEKQLLEDAF